MNQEPTPFNNFSNWVKTSITLRLVTIGILVLIMLIPISFITDLITERQQRRDEAVKEISSSWGAEQTVSGPVLTVPYKISTRVYSQDQKNYTVSETRELAQFLPENLEISSKIQPSVRYRGIYEAMLYNAEVSVKGYFKKPDVKTLNSDAETLIKQTFISVGISDLRNIEKVDLTFNGKTYAFNPGTESTALFPSGISVPVDIETAKDDSKLYFSYTLKFNGSSGIFFVPLGKETSVDINSPGQNPSFEGAFLPKSHNITKAGFDAHWQISNLNRNFQQSFTGVPEGIAASTFGVRLLIGVDEYQKNTRASKYAILFIMLTFMTFFFVQTINRIHIHPIQYLLVGLALVVFYVLLISISEHLNFTFAYLIASAAVITQISLYVKSMFKHNILTLVTALILVVLYTFIFVIIQLQDFALLVGSIGLFAVLAAAMYFSRNIDWYSLKTKKEEEKE
jgi:inner membrane protein